MGTNATNSVDAQIFCPSESAVILSLHIHRADFFALEILGFD